MKFTIIPIFLSLLNFTTVYSQSLIPEFYGFDLNDEKVSFPNDSKGKKTLLGFAFSTNAQEDLESWAQPVYDEFIDKESLAALVYDANVYLVIAFNKVNSGVRKKAIKELKENILEEFYPNIILSEVLAGELIEELNISDKKIPSLFTLDEEGNITATFSGRYSSKKMDKLSSFLENED